MKYEHGTLAGYNLGGCRCLECKAARRSYDKRRNDWLNGFEPGPWHEDIEEVRVHLERLRAAGVGLRTVSRLTGINRSSLFKVVNQAEKIRRGAAEAILALDVEESLPGGALVPPDEARAIVAELLAAGMTKRAIGRHVHGPQAIALQLHGDQVTVRNLRRLRQLRAQRRLEADRRGLWRALQMARRQA